MLEGRLLPNILYGRWGRLSAPPEKISGRGENFDENRPETIFPSKICLCRQKFQVDGKIFHLDSDLLDLSIGGKAATQDTLWSVGDLHATAGKISGRADSLTRIDQKPFPRLKSAFAVKIFRSTEKIFTSPLTC